MFAISLQYIEKELSNEVDFLHAGKHGSLLQIDTMIMMWIVKHSQSSPNSKFSMSLQHRKKEVRDEVDFLHADKHQSFLHLYLKQFEYQSYLQGDTIILDGHNETSLKYSKLQVCNIFTLSQKSS